MNETNYELLKVIKSTYPVYDYSFLLKMIKVWIEEAEKVYKTDPFLCNGKIIKVLKEMRILLSRIIGDDTEYEKHAEERYENPYILSYDVKHKKNNRGNMVIEHTNYYPNEKIYGRQIKLSANHIDMQRKQDIERFSLLFKKYIQRMWL